VTQIKVALVSLMLAGQKVCQNAATVIEASRRCAGVLRALQQVLSECPKITSCTYINFVRRFSIFPSRNGASIIGQTNNPHNSTPVVTAAAWPPWRLSLADMNTNEQDDIGAPKPLSRKPSSPTLLSNLNLSFFSEAFDRFAKDDLGTGFTLLGEYCQPKRNWPAVSDTKLTVWYADTIETFWDARIDLLERRIKKHSDRLKMKAGGAFKLAGTPTADLYTKDMEKEIQRFKEKVYLFPMLAPFASPD
jgi:hypothetical protein